MPFDFKRSLPFTLAVASGLVTSGMLYNILAHQPKAEASTMEPMVVLAGPVDDTRPLEAKDLSVIQVAGRPAGTFATMDEAVGRLPLVQIPGGQPLLTSHLAQRGATPGLWHQVPKGFRAVTVAVNEVVGVAGFISVGSFVDVIATMEVDQKAVSRIILQGIQVLAAAQNPQPEDEARAKIVSSVTLAVTPQAAEELTMATEKGTIRLAMRNPLESGTADTPGVTPGAVVGIKPPTVVVKTAPAKQIVKTVTRTVGVPVRAATPTDPGIMVIRGTTTSFVNH
jgi:pilus assembly protein CpaB